MANWKPTVKGFCRGRYRRSLMDENGRFVEHPPTPTSKLRLRNMAARVKAITDYDKRAKMDLPISIHDPRYQHLHPTKGYRTQPA